MMADVLWVAGLGLVFLACCFSGRLFDQHYGDRSELLAVSIVGVAVLVPMLFGAGSAHVLGLPTRALLMLAVAGGLLLGRHPGVA